jgi:rubrerythrin
MAMNQTISNVAKAFVGESQARNRYTMFASVARKEGYEQISAIFLETAEQEREHASVLYKFLNAQKPGPELKIDAAVPLAYGTTAENLKSAVAGENYEASTMYVEFADTAQKEGFKDIASRMRLITLAEKHHKERYQKLLDQIEKKTFFKKAEPTTWTCRQCGYVHTGKEPPESCPLCGHAKAFYQRLVEEY